MMNSNDLIILYVAFANSTSGKRRPVLIIQNSENNVLFFRITSKFATKSKYFQSKYYRIREWKSAGLKKVSYIDTSEVIEFSLGKIQKIYKIGELSTGDIKGLNEFIKKGS
ncbi:type II toxin-antitoxin system PemK/MazF family toxin [Companilactobacillus mishanensis]|uniref:Type II toxin-antitoxin system PemK/MazF family toxin n=1 Tax=Companilactobacillus mishanensis TaxID=2486008 RepID=A0ABW9P9K0_9LACO|nr:type II toxin-antitoxin system PemK/MazF family toxin [Companilactobacillus mishanensis]